MTNKLLKKVRAEVIKAKGKDLVLFIVGDVAEHILPTDEDLEKFGKMVRKVIKEPFPFMVLPPFIKTKILKGVLNENKKKGKEKKKTVRRNRRKTS